MLEDEEFDTVEHKKFMTESIWERFNSGFLLFVSDPEKRDRFLTIRKGDDKCTLAELVKVDDNEDMTSDDLIYSAYYQDGDDVPLFDKVRMVSETLITTDRAYELINYTIEHEEEYAFALASHLL